MPCAISKQSIFSRQCMPTMTAAQEHDDMLSCRCHCSSSIALHCSSRYRHRAIHTSSTSKLSRLFPPGVGWQQGGAVARLRHRQRCYLLPPYTCLTVPRFVLSLAPRSSQHRARPARLTSAVASPPCGAVWWPSVCVAVVARPNPPEC